MALSPQLTHRLSEGIAHHQNGRFDRAEAIYRQIATQSPRFAMVYELWGKLAEQQGRTDDAIRLLKRALQFDPRSLASTVELAGLYIATNRAADAEKATRQLTVLSPANFEAWNVLGFALKVLGRLEEAVACHRKAVELNPNFAEGWCNLGLTLMLGNRNYEALTHFERARRINPKLIAARYDRAQVLHKLYRTDEAIAEYDAVIAAEPRNLEARSYRLFALQTLAKITPERLFAEHQAYGKAAGRGPETLSGYDFSPHRRLRLGIHSPDFRLHACAFFIEPLLRGLNRDEFEVYLYHDHYSEDEFSARLKGLASVWRNLFGSSPQMFESQIRADRIDILMDLTGHVGNMVRLPSFARRLAPVQVTYLGYPDTTGVATMDYRFTDARVDPTGAADALATEKLVRFAPVAWTFQPIAGAPDVVPPPSASGGPVTFGCFNSPTKFTDDLFAVWGRIMAAVPDSRLILKGGDFGEAQVRAAMLERLARAGVPGERAELLPHTRDTRSHLEQYGRVDIALDTFPYNGTTTTCEALWMGRPVVTIAGCRHAARVGVSLLTAVGRPQYIAESVDAYVEKAVSLAAQPALIAAEAMSLRDAMRRSPMLDHAGQAACFGAALRQCWIEKTAVSAVRKP